MSESVASVRDLDLLLGTPITVKLGGREYQLPADCPAELYLQVLEFSKLADSDEDLSNQEEELTRALRDGMLDLFQTFQPDMERLPSAMSIGLLIQAIGAIYGPEEEDPTEASQEATPAPASTKKPKPKSKPKAATKPRRSSGSSAS